MEIKTTEEIIDNYGDAYDTDSIRCDIKWVRVDELISVLNGLRYVDDRVIDMLIDELSQSNPDKVERTLGSDKLSNPDSDNGNISGSDTDSFDGIVSGKSGRDTLEIDKQRIHREQEKRQNFIKFKVVK